MGEGSKFEPEFVLDTLIPMHRQFLTKVHRGKYKKKTTTR